MFLNINDNSTVVERVIQKKPHYLNNKLLDVEVMKPNVTALIVRGSLDNTKVS